MGTSKTNEFGLKENRIAAYAKALAHPARVAIINMLVRRETCICGELVDVLPLSQSTVSQHLKELKEAGLIKGEIEGTAICYCIDEKEWGKAQKLLSRLFESFEKGKSCC